MEVIKEGTYTYLLKQIEYRTPVYDESVVHTQNESWDYYLSVEYEILKRNELKTLVSAQLREKDEEKSLLFDITGKRPLKRQGKERAFSQKECEKILQNMSNMIQEVEDYMLDLNCIELRPEYIYEDSKGEIQWIYFPQTSLESEIKSNLQDRELQNKNEDLQKRMEALFAWMLPQIDYEDTDAVQFMYRFYNKVRKLGFSKELLETYIQTKRQKEYYDIEIQRIFISNNKDNKSMLIKVTDKKLLEKTGGIIQGMSGAPIIQNGKFVGAVTHVLVNDPTIGYGVFADIMLKQMKEVE